MTEAILLLGGNEGDPESTFREARRLIRERIGVLTKRSRLYESEPWGFEAERLFFNQALEVATDLEPLELLDAVQAIERESGRDRTAETVRKAQKGEKYASRPLDIDILFYGDEVIESRRLTVPHPLLAERAFALTPLAEIAPARRHPTTGKTATEMLQELQNGK